MKKREFPMIRSISLISIILLTGPLRANPWQYQAGVELVLPTGDVWSSTVWGAEVKAIRWWDLDITELGLAVSVGLSHWGIDDQIVQAGSVRDVWGGDVQFFPIGISILNRNNFPDVENVTSTFELGFRHVTSQSNVELTRTTTIPGLPADVEGFDVDSDDALLGRVGGILEWAINRGRWSATAFLNYGYQFDISQGDFTGVPWTQTEPQVLELAGFFVQAGVLLPIR